MHRIDARVLAILNRQKHPRRGEFCTPLKAGQEKMARPDLELLRLEQALRQAHERLMRITLSFSDRTVLTAAEDICADAATAVAEYKGKGSG